MVKTYGELYLDARKAFLGTEDQNSASLLSRSLLCHVSGLPQERILSERDTAAPETVCEAMDAAVRRVLDGEPLAYVLEEWDFYGMRLYVNRNVLIPRDDTCAVTALAVKQALFLNQDPRILDLCTGSGCIGLAIANRVKDARVTLADISPAAMAVAKKNISLQKLGGRVTCMQADALAPAPAFLGQFDMIVSNPPYVTESEMTELPGSVKDYEPHLALYGGQDGLDFYRSIVKNYTPALKNGGFLCLEFGMGQGDAVCEILIQNGYNIIERVNDFNDRERAVLARFYRKEE